MAKILSIHLFLLLLLVAGLSSCSSRYSQFTRKAKPQKKEIGLSKQKPIAAKQKIIIEQQVVLKPTAPLPYPQLSEHTLDIVEIRAEYHSEVQTALQLKQPKSIKADKPTTADKKNIDSSEIWIVVVLIALLILLGIALGGATGVLVVLVLAFLFIKILEA